jgi:hypothetical protein
MGGMSEYITGVTRRDSSSELMSPPMITTASGEKSPEHVVDVQLERPVGAARLPSAAIKRCS